MKENVSCKMLEFNKIADKSQMTTLSGKIVFNRLLKGIIRLLREF